LASSALRPLRLHVDVRADQESQSGRQILRNALETIIRVADAGGGKVIVVDADNEGLLGCYLRNGFKSTGVDGDLSLHMKMSTARNALRT
jgi:hypothetical protein